jgi:hypothetical protein
MPIIGPQSRYFAGQCFCETACTRGMGERAGWQCWGYPDCGAHHDLNHFYDDQGRWLGGRGSGAAGWAMPA